MVLFRMPEHFLNFQWYDVRGCAVYWRYRGCRAQKEANDLLLHADPLHEQM